MDESHIESVVCCLGMSFAYLECREYSILGSLCAGGEGFKQEIVKNNKLYGKLFNNKFGLLILAEIKK